MVVSNTQLVEIPECFTCSKRANHQVKVYSQKPWLPMPALDVLKQKFPQMPELYLVELAQQQYLWYDDPDGKIPHLHLKKQGNGGTAGQAGEKRQWQISELKVVSVTDPDLPSLFGQGWKPWGKSMSEACITTNGQTLIGLVKYKPAGG